MKQSQTAPARRQFQNEDDNVHNHSYRYVQSVWRIIADVVSLGILLVVSIISNTIAIPFTRGFFCADTTIKYPYKTNTIPTYAAVILSIGIPIIGMWTTEFLKRFYFHRYPKEPHTTELQMFGRRIIQINPFLRNLYILTAIFAYGYLATWLLTEVTKNFVGELRPHFLSVCQPSVDCTTLSATNQYSYLQFELNYTCNNPDTTAVREARRSFFSGHSSSVFFGFAWFIMYIHVSWSWRHLGIVAHLLQVGTAVLGLYIGYTRISDFHHHWHDVLVGGIVGSLVAFAAFKFILNWRHDHPRFLPYTLRNNGKHLSEQKSNNIHMNENNRTNSKQHTNF